MTGERELDHREGDEDSAGTTAISATEACPTHSYVHLDAPHSPCGEARPPAHAWRRQ